MRYLDLVRCGTCLVLLWTSLNAFAASMVWTNTSGGNWSNPINWDPHLVPGPPDIALITNAGSYSVLADEDGTVAGLILGGTSGTQSLSVATYSLTLRGQSQIRSSGILSLSGTGILDGAGDLSFDGKFIWTGGTMQGTGRTIVSQTNGLTITGGTLGRKLDLLTSYNLTGTLLGKAGGEINIFPGQTLDVVADLGYSSAVVNNRGTIRKSSGCCSILGFVVNNQGVIEVANGTLSLQGGGTSSGMFKENGGVLRFTGGMTTLTNGTTFTTAAVRMDLGSTLNIASDLTIEPLLELAGTLIGTGNATLNGGLKLIAGTLEGPGRTILPPQASFAIMGGGYLYRDVDLYGAGSLTGSNPTGGVGFAGGGKGAALTIFPGATFEVALDQWFYWNGTGARGVLNNRGTFRKMAGGPAEFQWVLNNSGLFQLNSGSLAIKGGGTSTGTFELQDGTFMNYESGVYSVSNGASYSTVGSAFLRASNGTFRVDSDLILNANFEVMGTGTLNALSNITFYNTFKLGGSGTFDGPGNITFNNTFNWSGGTMKGTGRTIIAPGARIAILGNTFSKNLRRHLDLHGNGSISGAGSLLGSNAVNFTILPTGVFDLLDNPTLGTQGSGAVPTLVNQGLLRKPDGTGTANIGFNVVNSGIVDSQTGTISFPRSYIQTGGSTLLSGGNLAGNLLDLRAGQLTGAGNIAANILSAADVFPGAPLNFLTVSGSVPKDFTSTPAGKMNLDLGGTVPGTGYDQVQVSGSANLAGTLNVAFLNGFVPALGSEFVVMTYSAHSGSFSGIAAPANTYFLPIYSPTNLILRTVTQGEVLPILVPAGFVGASTNRGFKITMIGELGGNYEIYAHTNVIAPSATWQLLGPMIGVGHSFEFLDGTFTNSPHRFYRAKQVP